MLEMHRDRVYCECLDRRVPKSWCDCLGGERMNDGPIMEPLTEDEEIELFLFDLSSMRDVRIKLTKNEACAIQPPVLE